MLTWEIAIWENIIGILLGLISSFMDVLIVDIFSLTCLLRRSDWRVVMQLMEEFQSKSSRENYRSRGFFYRTVLITAALMSFGMWFTFIILEKFNLTIVLNTPIPIVSEMVILFQCITMDIISCGYYDVSGYLENIIGKSKHNDACNKLRIVNLQLGVLYKILVQFNRLFGWSLLLITIKGFIIPLNVVHSLFIIFKINSQPHLIMVLCHVFVVLVS